MSPGCRIQSWVGVNSRSSFNSTSSRNASGGFGTGIDLPAPLALGLQQEHVVLVHVRADRTAGGGEADHHVVDAPARQEVEMPQDFAHVHVPLVHVLDQQGPVVVGHAGEFLLGERPAAQRPRIARAVVGDDPRQRHFLAGQAGQVFGFDRRDETREGVADQQRLLLPVVPQEFRWRTCRAAVWLVASISIMAWPLLQHCGFVGQAFVQPFGAAAWHKRGRRPCRPAVRWLRDRCATTDGWRTGAG